MEAGAESLPMWVRRGVSDIFPERNSRGSRCRMGWMICLLRELVCDRSGRATVRGEGGEAVTETVTPRFGDWEERL